MILYAIRQKGTELYLPAHKPSKPKRDYTWDKVEEKGGKYGPRLLPSRKSASQALRAWSRGRWSWVWDEEAFNGPRLSIDNRVDRDINSMEIVEFFLVPSRELARAKRTFEAEIRKLVQ